MGTTLRGAKATLPETWQLRDPEKHSTRSMDIEPTFAIQIDACEAKDEFVREADSVTQFNWVRLEDSAAKWRAWPSNYPS